MGEPEAIEAIRKGSVTIDGTKLKVVKQEHGWCDGCIYNKQETMPICPDLARHICCTGGYILIKGRR
jgi:hypothetical protein